MRRALTIFLVFVGIFIAQSAWAHSSGVSRGRYDLHGATLEAHVVFANAELASALPALDGNHDGAISADELASDADPLKNELVRRLTLRGDDADCPVTLVSQTMTEQDGVDIEMRGVCAHSPQKVIVHCGFLEVFAATHRHFATVTVDGGAPRESILLAGNVDLPLDAPGGATFAQLLKLGIEHILTGYDHLVFLFGLILLGGSLRAMIGALTAFTVAHSISLALAVLGVWAPSPAIVEPAIALSIAYVGVENLWRVHKGKLSADEDAARGRWRITFPFGLVHGFGFAGALQEIGLSRSEIPRALLGFNLGVEIGQLAVLAVVLPLLVFARRNAVVRGPVTSAANVLIVVAGTVWFVTRVWSGPS